MKNIIYIVVLNIICVQFISAQTLKITWPLDRAVFQRNGNSSSSTANVPIAGQFVCPPGSPTVKYRLVSLSKKGYAKTNPSWNTASLTSRSTFYVSSTSVTTGWYNLEVAQFSGSTIIASTSIKFGVGDVYIIAGQSNARGEDGENAGVDPNDCVSAANYNSFCSQNVSTFPSFQRMTTTNYIGPTGQSSWCYGKMANDLIDAFDLSDNSSLDSSYVVPHLFINAATVSTTIDNWISSANGTRQQQLENSAYFCNPESYGADAVYHPYRKLRDVLRYYGSIYGVRTVLWHQGEHDNFSESGAGTWNKTNLTSQADYRTRLKSLIDRSRSDFNANLNWVIAKVSLNIHKNPALSEVTRSQITNAQTTTYSSGNGVLETYTFAGPNSDARTNVTGDRNGGVHFDQSGLVNLGSDWKTNINSLNSSFSPIVANTTTSALTVVKNVGGTFTVTANPPVGYSTYRWVTNNLSYDSYFATTSSVTVSASSPAVRCYMQHSSGFWILSEDFTPSTCASSRIANSEVNLMEPSIKIYPNPINEYTNVEIYIPIEGNIRLEILDKNGKVIKQIVENVHAEGIFKYPVDSQYLKEGVYYLKASLNGTSITKRLILEEK